MARPDDAFPAAAADRLAAGGRERVEERSTGRFRPPTARVREYTAVYEGATLAAALAGADPSTAHRDEPLALVGGVS